MVVLSDIVSANAVAHKRIRSLTDSVFLGEAIQGDYDNGSASGNGRSEYIWLPTGDGAIPVGLFRNGRFFAIHSDHLGTPRLMKNDANKPVWQWPYSAFGTTKPTGVLTATARPKNAMSNQPVLLKGTGPAQRLDLRYPGQMDDPESGTNQNFWRSYDAKTGRYAQFDPIGLRGGINGYLYVDAAPLRGTDSMGLANSAATFWMRGKEPLKPEPPQMCENDQKCENTITVSVGGSCEPGDTMCVMSLQATGIKGPYAREYKTFDWKCLLKLGLGGKVGLTVAGNAAATQVPRMAQAAGASAATLGGIETGVAIFTSPAATMAGLSYGAYIVAKECECKAGTR